MVTLTVEYHDDTRTVVTREGMVETTSRPYTAEENAAADLRNARISNEASLRVDALSQLSVMMTSIGSLQTVFDKPNAELTVADTKTIARELRRVTRQVMRLTRLSLDAFDSSNVGSEQ